MSGDGSTAAGADEDKARNDAILEDGDDGHTSSDSEEDPEDYCKGGYHRVRIGDIFKRRYKVLEKLGWGHFSTVWLVVDQEEHKYAALKIVKSATNYTEAAKDEVKLLRAVRENNHRAAGTGHVVLLYDDFVHYGPNGKHVCMVMEVLGPNLLRVIKQHDYKGIPMNMVRRIVRQTLMGLESLHDHCRIIHTDIKPENILLSLNVRDERTLDARFGTGGDTKMPDVGKAFFSEDDAACAAPAPKKLTKNQKKNLRRRQKAKQMKGEQRIGVSAASVPHGADGAGGGADACGQASTVEAAPAAAKGAPLVTPVKCVEPPRAVQAALMRLPNVKLADLGNSCWVDEHFSADIQTRQYRCIEVILGADYTATADIWSVACMAFELATGDFLFEPHTHKAYSRDEDHCALISELLGPIPRSVAVSGEYANEIFTAKGDFRHIKKLKPWGLRDVLVEKYRFSTEDAAAFTDFLLPMLEIEKEKRASAAQCLKHPWLRPCQQEVADERLVMDYLTNGTTAIVGDGKAEDGKSCDQHDFDLTPADSKAGLA
mmetsp:Transcript_603/g.1743  ORF Transcript_603/g.1743 Transcript_603/m.1743 type:complete len:544 (+) Transcript_603:113-1744(+)|eukprot:CAMPEP_0182928566 /NCGR_PEP_ID=MMETSP0105_2-20130417/15652_1 /TAXON_ID=81532 ORGANISM="Acanthoeca-like sp., Strain 10tr" /NCGR_SAMPLE_ID=MMETSP0105_2 /ASSEMBLY_ACC=CAM_ASM_000205 /LENGTH=543 /DNA_ID=CAMNT_0025066571 /DNA_START=42 /DNA_END=1673 /DNA_ORIENTATION=-